MEKQIIRIFEPDKTNFDVDLAFYKAEIITTNNPDFLKKRGREIKTVFNRSGIVAKEC